jgi:ferritin-like metal-binding protein YciE
MNVSSWFSKMVGASMTLDNLQNVLIMQLRDLASAEEQLIQALPKMAKAASSSQLKQAFKSHLEETKLQRKRLDQAFELLETERGSVSCDAMKGLISEGEEIMNLDGDKDVKDAALIAAAQRVEHYEIAGYGCARAFARRLGHRKLAALLQKTLNEEGKADKKLTTIAEGSVNPVAASNGKSNGRKPAKSPRRAAKKMAKAR